MRTPTSQNPHAEPSSAPFSTTTTYIASRSRLVADSPQPKAQRLNDDCGTPSVSLADFFRLRSSARFGPSTCCSCTAFSSAATSAPLPGRTSSRSIASRTVAKDCEALLHKRIDRLAVKRLSTNARRTRTAFAAAWSSPTSRRGRRLCHHPRVHLVRLLERRPQFRQSSLPDHGPSIACNSPGTHAPRFFGQALVAESRRPSGLWRAPEQVSETWLARLTCR